MAYPCQSDISVAKYNHVTLSRRDFPAKDDISFRGAFDRSRLSHELL